MSLLYASRMMEFRQDGYEEGLHTGLFTGCEEGISIGLERGAYQKALETARSLLAYGDAPEKVALCTGLPLELVQQLAQETVK